MSKGLKPIIITLAVIALLIVAMCLLIYVFPENDDETPEVTASSASVDSVYVIKEDSTTLKSFEAISPDGETLHVDYIRGENGSLSYKATPELDIFTYDESKFKSMMYSLTSLSATSLVEEDAANISIYGLSDPRFTIKLAFTDGRNIDVYIGNTTPVDRGYYIKTSINNRIYTIGTYMAELLMRTELDYRDITLFPAYTEDDVYTNISRVSMTMRDGTEVELLQDPEYTYPGNQASSNFVMTMPILCSTDNAAVQSDVLDVVSTITFGEALLEITEDDFAEYGFDTPARLQMSDTSGNEMDILIGDSTETGGYYYALLTDKPTTLFTCEAEAFYWIDNLNYMTLVNRALWLQSIKDVVSIEYDISGEKYVLNMKYEDGTDADGNEKAILISTLNDKEISDTNCKRLFARTLNLRTIGLLPEDTEYEAKAECTIKMTLTDGNIRTVEFHKINERQYAVLSEAAPQYVYKLNLDTITDALTRLMEGRSLPLNYNT